MVREEKQRRARERSHCSPVVPTETEDGGVGGSLLRRYGESLSTTAFGEKEEGFLLFFWLLKYFGSIFDPELILLL